MPEGFKAQISASQGEITRLQEGADSPELKNTLQKYQNTFFEEVNTAQVELAKTEDQLLSPQAKALLQNAPAKILEFMMKIGQKGAAIKKTQDQKEKTNVSSIDQLARELESFLNEEKAELPNFVAITEIAKNNEELENHPPTTDPEKLIQAKKELIAKLPTTTKISTSYKQEIAQKIQDSMTDLGIFKADQLLLKISTTDLQTLEKLTQEYEHKPTSENFAKVQEVRNKIDLKKLGDEVFNGKIDGNNPLISSLYQKLWQEQFQATEKRLTTLADRIDAKEKTVLAPQIIILLAATEKTWEQVLQPKMIQYEQTNAFAENHTELEKGLFADLLKTRSLLAPFANERNKDKLEFTVFQGLTDRFQKINETIKKIETNREVHRNDQDMSSQGLLQYVKFPTKDGDQVVNDQNYSFTPAFYQLPEAQQLVIRSQIEKIAAQNKLSVQKETEKASLEFLQPEEKLQKLAEMLGEKGKPYFSALEKLKNKDVDGAIEIFQIYLNQSFSSEDLKIQRETLQDAKEKIQGLFNEKLNQVNNLLSDVKQLKQAERKLGGNPELHVDESIEVSAIEEEISIFRKEILAGKVLNFNERFTDLQKNVRAKLAEKQSSETDILKKLEQLHSLSLEHDPKKRKEGFVAFAQEARDMQGYHLAKKYLDYALADEFQKASKDLSRQEVLKQMVTEPDFLPKLKEQAQLAHSKMIQENPALRGKLTLEVVQDQLLQGELDTRYSKELRKFITPVDSTNASLEKYDSALALYNNWFPLEQTLWYNPLEYGAEEWDNFQVDCVKFVFEQLPTLGIGMAAGAAGRAGAKLAGKAVLKYLVKTGLSEAEIALVEGGGIQALKASLTSGKAFTLGASRLLGAVALEGTTMYGLGQAQQFLETGHVQDFEKSPGKNISEHLLESMVKVSVFKAIGMGTQMIKPLAAASEKGGNIAKAAWLGRETLSGAGGTILDYAIGKLKGHDMSGQEIFQAMISNYLISIGMSAAENHGDSRKTKEMIEKYGKEKIAAEKILRQRDVEQTSEREKVKDQIEDLKKMIEDPNISLEKRGALEQIVQNYERNELIFHELTKASSDLLEEHRVVTIEDSKNPGKKEALDLFKNYKSKNFASSPEMAELMNSYEKVFKEGPIIIKNGGDEIVILHAGPDGKVQMFYGDVGNMGPTNEFSLRLKNNNANLVDLYLHDFSEIVKEHMKPGKAVNGGEFLNDIKSKLSKKYFGIETEAEFNSLKQKWNLEGDFGDYSRNMENARNLAGFRKAARGLQKEFLSQPGIDGQSMDQNAFAEFVGKKIAELDKGMPSLKELLKIHFEMFSDSGALNDFLPKEIAEKNPQAINKEKLAEILSKTNPTAEEQLIIYYALKKIDAEKIPARDSDKISIKNRFKKVRQTSEDARLMDFQMAGMALPAFSDLKRPITLADQKILLEHILEDKLHEAKTNPDELKIYKGENPFDHEGKINNERADAQKLTEAHKKANEDHRAQTIAETLGQISEAQRIQSELQKLIQDSINTKNISSENQKSILKLKAQYEVVIRKLMQDKFKDAETGADRPGKFALDANIWLRNGEGKMPQTEILREFVIDLHNTGSINAKSYAATDAAMKVIFQQLSVRFPAISSIIRTGGGEFKIMFFDEATLPQKDGKTISLTDQAIQITEALHEINPLIQEIIQPDSKILVDGIVRDSTEFLRTRGSKGGKVGELSLTSTFGMSHDQFSATLAKLGTPKSLFAMRDPRNTLTK